MFQKIKTTGVILMITKFFFNDYLVLFPWDVREADVK